MTVPVELSRSRGRMDSLFRVVVEDTRGLAGVEDKLSRDAELRKGGLLILSLEDFRLSREGAARKLPATGTGSLEGLGMPEGLGLVDGSMAQNARNNERMCSVADHSAVGEDGWPNNDYADAEIQKERKKELQLAMKWGVRDHQK